jgi:hypothetical protein
MPTRYSINYNNKSELYAIMGEKISTINIKLINNTEQIDGQMLEEIIEAVDFLKDHKYQLTDQGLNQLEYIIRSAEERLKLLKG